MSGPCVRCGEPWQLWDGTLCPWCYDDRLDAIGASGERTGIGIVRPQRVGYALIGWPDGTFRLGWGRDYGCEDSVVPQLRVGDAIEMLADMVPGEKMRGFWMRGTFATITDPPGDPRSRTIGYLVPQALSSDGAKNTANWFPIGKARVRRVADDLRPSDSEPSEPTVTGIHQVGDAPAEVYVSDVSDEPLEIIRDNECNARPGLATSRFRRLWNELSLARAAAATAAATSAPIPMTLWCPLCHERHIDRGVFATTKHHHTHSCQRCGLSWRPAVVCTVGVEFLPGFKDAPAEVAPVVPDNVPMAGSLVAYECVDCKEIFVHTRSTFVDAGGKHTKGTHPDHCHGRLRFLENAGFEARCACGPIECMPGQRCPTRDGATTRRATEVRFRLLRERRPRP